MFHTYSLTISSGEALTGIHPLILFWEMISLQKQLHQHSLYYEVSNKRTDLAENQRTSKSKLFLMRFRDCLKKVFNLIISPLPSQLNHLNIQVLPEHTFSTYFLHFAWKLPEETLAQHLLLSARFSLWMQTVEMPSSAVGNGTTLKDFLVSFLSFHW